MDDAAPVDGASSVEPASGPTGDVTTPAAPTGPVDSFEAAPPPRVQGTPPPANPPTQVDSFAPTKAKEEPARTQEPAKTQQPEQPKDRYDAAGPEVRQQLKDNIKALGAARKSGDPAKNFFDFTLKAQERADLLQKVEDKSAPGKDKDDVTYERKNWAGMAGMNYGRFKNDKQLQEQLKALPPEQQKAFQAGMERSDADEAKRKAAPLSPEEQRKEDLIKVTSSAPLKLLNLSSEANRDPAKALDYAKVWNEADTARRELGDPATKAWYGAKRDVLTDAMGKPGVGDELYQKLSDERDRTDAAESKDRIKELDQEIADIKSGKNQIGDVAQRERQKAWHQDRIDKVEGKGPPTNAYQVEKKQLETQRDDLDKQIADLKAKNAPPPPKPQGAEGNGTGTGAGTGNGAGTGVQPANNGPDSADAARMRRLEKERSELGQKIEKLDANHRDDLNDYARRMAEQATRAPQKSLDGLLQKQADLDKQLKDPDLDPGKRGDLEKQRDALKTDVTKAKDEVKKAEQQALDKVRTDAKKSSGAEQLWKEGEDFKKQAGEYQDAAGLPAKRVAVDKAKENLAFTEQRLEQVKKERDLVAKDRLSFTSDGKAIPKAEKMKELDERVNGLEKDLARDRARFARAQATLAGDEVEGKRLEAQRRLKYAQATAAEVGPQRLGERLGKSGLPQDLESEYRTAAQSPDPKVREAAASKVADWLANNPRLGGDAKAELRDIGRRLGFEPHDDPGLYRMGKNADAAHQDWQKAKADAERTAAEADKLEAEAKAKGVEVPPPPTPFTPEKKFFQAPPPEKKDAPPPADPQPAQGKQPEEPKKELPKINPAISPEDQAHLDRQLKELGEMGKNIWKKIGPTVEGLGEMMAQLPGSSGSTAPKAPGGGNSPGFDLDKLVPEGVKEFAHNTLKSVLENPDAMKWLMERERRAYGFFSQAAGMVGGLYTLGEMGVKGLGQVAKDPVGTAEKVWNGLKYAAENPDKVLKDTWDGMAKIGKHFKEEIVKSYEKDPEEFKGRAAFEVLSILFPFGKAGKAGEAGKVLEKTAEVANAAEKTAEVVNAAGKTAEVAKAAEKTAEVAKAAEKTAEVTKAAEKTADATKTAEKTADATKTAEKAADAANKVEKSEDVLQPGTKAYQDLKQKVEAKEELSRRLKDSLPGGKHEPAPGAKGKSMSGAGEMKPEQIQQQIAKLEKEAAEGRKALEKADQALAKTPEARLDGLRKAVGDLDSPEAVAALKALEGKDLKGLEHAVLGQKGDRLVYVDHTGKLADIKVTPANAKKVLEGVKTADETLGRATGSYELRKAVLERSGGDITSLEAYTFKPPLDKTGAPLSRDALREWRMDPANWLPERRAVQQKIFDEGLKKAEELSKLAEPNTLYALRGNTAAGKSTAVKSNEQFQSMSKALDGAINPDTYKFGLRQADATADGVMTTASKQVHEEGVLIASRIEQKMLEKPGASLVYDKRFAWPSEMENLLARAETTGKNIKVVDLDTPLELSAGRVLTRKASGDAPLVPFDAVAEGFDLIRKNRGEMLFGKDGKSGLVNNPRVKDYELHVADETGKTVKVAYKKDGVWHSPKPEHQALFDRAVSTDVTADLARVKAQVIDQAFIDKMVSTAPPHFQAQMRASLEEFRGKTLKEALDAKSKLINEPVAGK